MHKKSYSSFAKKDDFIGKYMRSQSNLETPLSYDFWGAIWILSTLLGRDVIVDRPAAPVYLNWYVILIANSGITRKSTAVNNANYFLRGYLRDYSAEHNILLPDARTTVEGFEKELLLMDKAHAAINVSELVRFMGKERYTSQMPGFLTDLYDCPEVRSTMLKSEDVREIHDVYITLLSASTPEWLNKAVNPEVIEGGFASRVMFIYENTRKKRVAWPVMVEEDTTPLMVELHERVETARAQGIIPLTKKAKARFISWYNAKIHHNGQFAPSFESREDAHVLKLAAMLAISGGTYQIQTTHVSLAIKLVENVKQDGMQLFDTGVVQDNEQKAINKITQRLIAADGSAIKLRSLKQSVKSWLKGEQVNMLMATMAEARMIEQFDRRLGTRGTKSRVIKALPALYDDDLRAEVHRQMCHS